MTKAYLILHPTFFPDTNQYYAKIKDKTFGSKCTGVISQRHYQFQALYSRTSLHKHANLPYSFIPYTFNLTSLKTTIDSSKIKVGQVHYAIKEGQVHYANMGNIPLLCPFWSRNTVQSSIFPKGANIIFTSVSLNFFDSMPINNFLSSEIEKKILVEYNIIYNYKLLYITFAFLQGESLFPTGIYPLFKLQVHFKIPLCFACC